MNNQNVKTSLKAIMAAMVLSFALVACNNGTDASAKEAAPADTAKAAPAPVVDSAAAKPVDSASMKKDSSATKKDTAKTKPVVTK